MWEEDEPIETLEPTAQHYALVGEAFRDVLEWITAGNPDHNYYGEKCKNRMFAVVWILRPELLDNQSLSKFCNRAGIGANKWTISKHAQAFTRRFGIRGINQRKDHTHGEPEKEKQYKTKANRQLEFEF